jgi:hypothetical protein
VCAGGTCPSFLVLREVACENELPAQSATPNCPMCKNDLTEFLKCHSYITTEKKQPPPRATSTSRVPPPQQPAMQPAPPKATTTPPPPPSNTPGMTPAASVAPSNVTSAAAAVAAAPTPATEPTENGAAPLPTPLPVLPTALVSVSSPFLPPVKRMKSDTSRVAPSRGRPHPLSAAHPKGRRDVKDPPKSAKTPAVGTVAVVSARCCSTRCIFYQQTTTAGLLNRWQTIPRPALGWFRRLESLSACLRTPTTTHDAVSRTAAVAHRLCWIRLGCFRPCLTRALATGSSNWQKHTRAVCCARKLCRSH